MASINFLYRSKRELAPLNIRFLHTCKDGTIIQLGARTKLIVDKYYWHNFHKRNRHKDIEVKEKQAEINRTLNEIEKFVISEFNYAPNEKLPKDWLKRVIEKFYKRHHTNNLPLDLIGYSNYYIHLKKKDWSHKTYQSHQSTRNKLLRMQDDLNQTILVKQVNQKFREQYIQFCEEQSYSKNTMQREFGRIKEYCRHAGRNGLKIYNHLNDLTISGEDTQSVYLTREELTKLRDLEISNERLSNARDWLLVACYTGQRISDFMRFKNDFIRKHGEAIILEFRQVKPPSRYISVPLSRELQHLLKKRNNFPKPISEQKFNDYAKEVCKMAKIDEMTEGSKRINVTPDSETSNIRLVKGTFPKYELISSHVGRRSFATNYFGIIPTTHLMSITGHTRESTFLRYIRKSNTDLASEAYRLLQM